jgi:hypothetical protein
VLVLLGLVLVLALLLVLELELLVLLLELRLLRLVLLFLRFGLIRKNSAAATAASRGTVESVASCMDVNTWTMLMTRLTTTAIARTGPASRNTSCKVRAPRSTT